MFVSEIRDYSNGVAFRGLKGFKPQNKSDVFYINRKMSEQLHSIGKAFNEIYDSLRKLDVQKENSSAQGIFEQITTKHNIKKLSLNAAEGFTISSEKTNYILSTHGNGTFRLREQNPLTGEIQKSHFIKDEILIKTDTKQNVPQQLEPMTNNDLNREQFNKEFNPILDEVDFSLLKLRRDIYKPEVQAEIRKVNPEVSQALAAKNFILQGEPILVSKPAIPVEKPQKKLLSYYQKMLAEQRTQTAANPQPVKEKLQAATKVSETSTHSEDKLKTSRKSESLEVVKPAKRRGRPPKIRPVIEEPPLVKETKRRGRPPKVKPILEEQPVVKEMKRRGRPPKAIAAQTEPAGVLSGQQNIIDSIFANYTRYKKEFVNLGIPRRKKLHEAVGFETKQGNPSILMRNVGEKGEHLHLSFPKFKNRQGIKIQVLGENDAVEKVYYIVDNKMVKFNADGGIHSRQHTDRNIHYFSQREIDNSDVTKYLKMVDERMSFAAQQLDNAKIGTNLRLFNHRIDNSRKSFVSQVQSNLADFQSELANKLKTSTVDISRTAQDGLAEIQKNTTAALETLKQKLMELIKPV